MRTSQWSVQCDRCGNTTAEEIGAPQFGTVVVQSPGVDDGKWDLCPTCVTRFASTTMPVFLASPLE